MKRFLLVALLWSSGIALASPIDTPTAVVTALDRLGAREFFANLSDRDADTLFDHIAMGQASWVALAPRLAAGADAGNSEGLAIALAAALPKNPEAVLAVIDPVSREGHSIDVRRVCGIPFIEVVPPGYQADAIRAVRRVTNPKFRSIRERCLKALGKS